MHALLGFVSFVNVFFGRHLAFYFGLDLAAGAFGLYQTVEGDEILRSPPLNPALLPSLQVETVVVSPIIHTLRSNLGHTMNIDDRQGPHREGTLHFIHTYLLTLSRQSSAFHGFFSSNMSTYSP
jgi:hypothetical protein